VIWDRSFVRDVVIAGSISFCLIVIGIYRAARRPATDGKTSVGAQVRVDLDGKAQEPIPGADRPSRKSLRQLALEEIARHEEVIALDPEGTDTPAYTLAIANLYSQKVGDHESAAAYLEELIAHFPESDLVPQAFAKLARCYENLGMETTAEATYKRMMRSFPEHSNNWEYARAKLRGVENVY